MSLFKFILDILIVLLLLRLLIRSSEAFFNPIYRIIYRVTNPVLLPARYITPTPAVGIIFTVAVLVVLRGALYSSAAGWPVEIGIGRSVVELLQLLFQAYMVIWVVGTLSARGSTVLIQMMARAFLPVDAAIRWFGIPRRRIHIASFFFLWILYGISVSITRSFLIVKAVPSASQFVEGFAEGLLLFVGLFPFPGFFSIVIFVAAILSWVSPDPANPVVQTIYGIAEPLLAPFRRFVPHLGGIDLSPLVALLAFQILGSMAQQLIVAVMGSISRALI
jgi:YggT family protein